MQFLSAGKSYVSYYNVSEYINDTNSLTLKRLNESKYNFLLAMAKAHGAEFRDGYRTGAYAIDYLLFHFSGKDLEEEDRYFSPRKKIFNKNKRKQ